jgi:mono/diheme cytochrome c family protein
MREIRGPLPSARRASLVLAWLLLAIGPSCSDEPPSQSPAASPSPQAPPPSSASSPPAPAAPPSSAPASAAPAADGSVVYATFCATCHGPQGKGDCPGAAALDPKPRNFTSGEFKFDPSGDGKRGELEDIAAVVRDGAAKYGGSPNMVPWGAVLSPAQLEAVAKYVKSLGSS